jgi:hypothetical protein
VPTQLLNYFRTQGILPNNLSEEQKKMIQNQLSMQKSLRSAVQQSHIEPIDDFFAAKKEEFLQKLQSKGHDFFTCKDFIETKGLVSLNPDLLVANMGNLNYVNPLKI